MPASALSTTSPPTSDVLSTAGAPTAGLRPDALPVVRKDEVALMFSGGVDSTATAIQLSDHFRRVHLITYRNGYGHYYHHRTRKRVDELNEKLGDRFTYSLISTKGYFDRILVDKVLEDYKEYKSGFIWFMGCKMAMHMRSAIYCLENGLVTMTDGSNSETDEMVEQMLISLSLIRAFYKGLTVEFGTPVYEATRDESRAVIDGLGLKLGVKVLDRHLCIQPTCIAGELYYMPYLLFNKKVQHDEATVARFIQQKSEICLRIVEEYFASRGVDLQALLADRRAQLEALAAPAAPAGAALPSQEAV